MKDKDRDILRSRIAPLVQRGEASLLLGAGFSIVNESSAGLLPSADGLRDMILSSAGRAPGKKTTLKDAYLLGTREIKDFQVFLAQCFTVSGVHAWQERVFAYAWNRVYTTNIDNVLNVAHAACVRKGQVSGDFVFTNYCSPAAPSSFIGAMPVVTIHGSCLNLSEGFVFSSLEYARASARMLDWHRDLAARVMAGGLIVIGNQLDESDLDAHLAIREIAYGSEKPPFNFMVTPGPDEIKASNYEAAGFTIIDCTAEEFFAELFATVRPKSVAEIVIEATPSIKRAVVNIKAMTWFKSAFRSSVLEIERAGQETGILRHFVSGADPDWFYVVNDAHASTSVIARLIERVNDLIQANAKGVGVLHVTGPSGSGKTTAIRGAVRQLVRTYPYIYEFDSGKEVDTDLLRSVVEGFSEKVIFVFHSAAEYYYAVNIIADRLQNHSKPYTLFILEDRTSEHKKSYRQIADPKRSHYFEIPSLDFGDATLIVQKMEESGLVIEGFSELMIAKRAGVLVDKERGYSGDLLTALFSLTSHENFERKVFEEYHATPDGLPRRVLNVVSILGSHGFAVPVEYIGGFLGERPDTIAQCLASDLAGVLVRDQKAASVKCRHRIIAQYYFTTCISGKGSVETIVGMLEFLSRMFRVEDIKFHPLPYRMYKEIISFEFLHDAYFPHAKRLAATERTYHEAQRFFGRDGIFWLHFGRYYRKTKRWDEAIDCFRSGLKFFDSFQTRHSLGTAMLEKYLGGDCKEAELYKEGVQLLENERQARGLSDPYPTTTLLALLMRIVECGSQQNDAVARVKDCINAGLKYFADDQFFRDLFARYVKLSTGQ